MNRYQNQPKIDRFGISASSISIFDLALIRDFKLIFGIFVPTRGTDNLASEFGNLLAGKHHQFEIQPE